MLPNTGQMALVVAVAYLIIFFLLGSGIFNSIIEGPGQSNKLHSLSLPGPFKRSEKRL